MTLWLTYKAKKFISPLLLASVLLCSPAPAVAQTNTAGTIRVESNEVFVPVLVVDSQRLQKLEHMNYLVFQHDLDDGDFQSLESLAVPGLLLKDFTVLQDGEPQRMVSVIPEGQRQEPIIADNLGKYREYVGVGGGAWTVPLWESYGSPWTPVAESPSFSGYAIGFMPPPSSDGSCHKLQVLVDRPNSLVFSRNEYCQPSSQAADPLRGTPLGERIESDLGKDMRNQLTLKLAATPLFADNSSVPARVVLDYAPTSNPLMADCNYKPEPIGIIGTLLDRSGQEILRFSDEAVREDDNSLATKLWSKLGSDFLFDECYFYAPIRYETQIEIAPGQYHLEIGFMDGRKFSRAVAELTVPSYPGDQLSISGIVLASRFRDLQSQPPRLPIGATSTYFRDAPTVQARSVTALPEKYLPLITKGIEVTPTANVRFKRKGQFYFYVQVYEPPNSAAQQPSVNLNLRIVSDETNEVVRQLQPVNAAPYEVPNSPIIPIGGGVLIANLPKGTYELQAQATDSTGATTPWRSVAFAVE
ncbi:MAG: hypothetical protein WBQ34_03340 [Candidatus Acidiferrales bacterium]